MKARLFLSAAVALLASWAGAAHAFCVENYTTARVDAVQLYHLSGMSKQISVMSRPGELAALNGIKVPGYNPNAAPVPGRECCNWKEKSCNKAGKQDSTVSFIINIMVKRGTNIGIGSVGDERYQCGQIDGNDNMAVPMEAGGRIAVSPNDKFNAGKQPSASNPKFLALVFDVADRHVKTYPCPGAPRKASWSDLIPDWSDVIAG